MLAHYITHQILTKDHISFKYFELQYLTKHAPLEFQNHNTSRNFDSAQQYLGVRVQQMKMQRNIDNGSRRQITVTKTDPTDATKNESKIQNAKNLDSFTQETGIIVVRLSFRVAEPVLDVKIGI